MSETNNTQEKKAKGAKTKGKNEGETDAKADKNKVAKAEIYVNVASAVASPHLATAFGMTAPIDVRFIVVESSEGKPLIATVTKDNVVTLQCYEYFAAKVGLASLHSGITLLSAGLKEVYALFCNIGKRIPFASIKTIATKDHTGYTFNRVDVSETDPIGETPLFDEMLTRTLGTKELQWFIGSLLYESSKAQYLWVYGKGGNGKSSLIKVITHALQGAATTDIAPTKGREHFWIHRVLGKRLIAIPDCNKPEFVQSDYFKTLTGEDEVAVERKGQDYFTIPLETKFMFASNEYPAIAAEKSETRRAIICHMKPLAKGTPMRYEYQEELMAEAKDILRKCMRVYKDSGEKICVLGKDSRKIRQQMITDHNAQYWAFFEKHCTLEAGYREKGSRLFEKATDDRKDNRWYAKFVMWLQKEQKVKKINKGNRVFLKGVKVKETAF